VVPPQLTAAHDAVTPTTIHLSWTAPVNLQVDHYVVSRGSTLANMVPVYTNEHGTTKDDVGLPSGVNTWVYKVAAVGATTANSNTSIATTIKFDDDPITSFATTIFAHHVEQLRQAIDSIRLAAGLSAVNWADGSSLQHVGIKAQHVAQMQDQLTAALTQLNVTSPPYTALASYVRAQDISEVRAHVK
jgi:hypothetical protein